MRNSSPASQPQWCCINRFCFLQKIFVANRNNTETQGDFLKAKKLSQWSSSSPLPPSLSSSGNSSAFPICTDCSYFVWNTVENRMRGTRRQSCAKYPAWNASCAILAPTLIQLISKREQTSLWLCTFICSFLLPFLVPQIDKSCQTSLWTVLVCWNNSHRTYSSHNICPRSVILVPSSSKAKPNTAQNLLACFPLILVWCTPLPTQCLEVPPSNTLHAGGLCFLTDSPGFPLLQSTCT